MDQEEADAAKRMAAVLDRPKAEDSSEPASSRASRSSDVALTSAAGSNKKAVLCALESALVADEDTKQM